MPLEAQTIVAAKKALGKGKFIAILDEKMIDTYWESVRRGLEAHADLFLQFDTVDSFYYKAKNSLIQIFVVGDRKQIDFIMITQVAKGARHKIMQVIGAWGQFFEEYEQLILSVMNDVAIEFECEEVEIVSARRGWLRRLEKYGFREAYTVAKVSVDHTKGMN